MNVLIDTCIWSLALRRMEPRKSTEISELSRLVTGGNAMLLGAVRQEILSGVREKSQFERLKDALSAFPDIMLATDDYVTAALFFNLCRRHGIQGANTDFLLCAVAVRHDIPIFTTDRDFPLFARHLPIVLHKYADSPMTDKG